MHLQNRMLVSTRNKIMARTKDFGYYDLFLVLISCNSKYSAHRLSTGLCLISSRSQTFPRKKNMTQSKFHKDKWKIQHVSTAIQDCSVKCVMIIQLRYHFLSFRGENSWCGSNEGALPIKKQLVHRDHLALLGHSEER